MPTSHFRSCLRFKLRSSGVLGYPSTLRALAYGKTIPFKARSLSNFYPLERFLKVEFEVEDNKQFFFKIHVTFCQSPFFSNFCHSAGWEDELGTLTVSFAVKLSMISLGICFCDHVHCLLCCPLFLIFCNVFF